MEVSALVQEFSEVAGLDEYEAKKCIYWSRATHFLNDFSDLFPILELNGSTGTGKSTVMKLIGDLAKDAASISCKRISTSDLRTELAGRWERTVLLEEAEDAVELGASESLISARCSRSTSNIGFKIREKSNWTPAHEDVFGATVVHHRQPFVDQATQNRAITVTTHFIPNRSFKPAPNGLMLPFGSIKPVPKSASIAGRAFDTWKPLLYIANWFGDNEWLWWAQIQMEEAGDELKDGQSFEMKSTILSRLIEVLTNENKGELVIQPIKVDIEITRSLKSNMPWLTPQQVNTVLKGLGFHIERRGGRLTLYPTLEAVKKAADKIGLEDKLL